MLWASFQLAHGQALKGSKSNDGSYQVLEQGTSLLLQTHEGTQQVLPASTLQPTDRKTTKKQKRFIVEFVERPFLLEKRQRGGLSNVQYQTRFAAFSRDVNRLTQRSKGVVSIRRQYYKVFFGAEVELYEDQAAALGKLPYVKRVTEDYAVNALLDQSVGLIKADAVWNQLGNRGEGITVGIIDTGIDYTHPALGLGLGAGFKVTGGYDFVNDDNDPMDDHGHGTHCAGIVAADGSTIQGVAPKANLVALKVLGANGSGVMSDVIAALEWAADPDQDGNDSDKLDVVSMSLGGAGDPDDPASLAVDHAVSLGIVVCVAAGNNYNYYGISSPGAARDAITVGASDDSGNIASFSSKGPNKKLFSVKPEIVAPGVDIYATVPGNAFESKSGTSMATPHIAGVAALLRSLHPGWTPDQVKSAIMTTATDLGKEAMMQGSGQADALKAARTSTFIHPAHLSFGLVGNVNTDVRKDTITVTNAGNGVKSYTTATSGLVSGLTLTADPASFSLSPGSTQQVVVTATADHAALPYPSSGSGSFSGKVTFLGNADTLSVPWALVKSGKLILSFDAPSPTVIISGRKNSYSVSLTQNGLRGEALVNPDTLDILYLRGESMIIRENIVFNGMDSLHISDSEAAHTVALQGVDENGNILHGTGQYRKIKFPKGSYLDYTLTLGTLPYVEFRMSSFSPRFKVQLSQMKEDVTGTHTIHNIQHPLIEGLQNNITLANVPADYISQNLQLHAATDSAFRLGVGNAFMQYGTTTGLTTFHFAGSFTGSWQGTLFQTKNSHLTYQSNVSLDAFKFTPESVFEYILDLPPFVSSGDSLTVSREIPPSEEIYRSPHGGSMAFGNGAFYPIYNYNTNDNSDIYFYGKFNELLSYEKTLATYRLYNAQEILVDSGQLTNLNSGKLLAGKNHLEVTLDPMRNPGLPCSGTYKATFDMSASDHMPPVLTSLLVLDAQGISSDTLEQGEYSSLRFSFRSGFTDKHLFVKPHAAQQWKELQLKKIAEEPDGPVPFGYLYEAVLASFDTTGLMDVKITASDASANQMEWVLENAFVVKDEIQAFLDVSQGATTVSSSGNYDFGGFIVGQTSAPATFTVLNTGIDPLVIANPIRLSSGSNVFFQLNTAAMQYTIPPGGSTTFDVTFTASQSGIKTDTLWIKSNAGNDNPFWFVLKGSSVGPEMEVKVSGSAIASSGIFDFGNTSVNFSNYKTFTVENKGSANLNFTGTPKVQFTGADASLFTITSNNLPAALAPGASATFIVQFRPTTPGAKNAMINIPNSDSDENPYLIALAGNGMAGHINVKYAGADLVQNVSIVDMGTFPPGQSSGPYTFTVENVGVGTLGFYSTPKVGKSGINAGDFIINAGTMPYELGPGNTTTFTVSFAPSGAECGSRTAEIRVSSNDYDEPSFVFTVKGTVPGPEAHVSYFSSPLYNGTGSFTLNPAYVGQTGNAYRFTLENKGTESLLLNGAPPVRVSGPDSLDFIVNHSAITGSLAASQSVYFYISFRPTAAGVRTAKIVIANNDADEHPYTFNVKAQGIAMPGASASMTSARRASDSDEALIQEEEETEPVKVFPNPSQERFTVWTGGKSEKIQARAFNYQGIVVGTFTWSGGAFESIGENWKPGFYLLEVQNSQKRIVIKLIKE